MRSFLLGVESKVLLLIQRKGGVVVEGIHKRLDEKVVTLYRRRGITIFLFCLAISVEAYFIFKDSHWDMLLYSIIPIVAIPLSLYHLLFVPKRVYEIFRYKVVENRIDLQSGILVVSQTVIPMFRVQHVQTAQGPIMKKLGLSKLIVYTAGSVYQIPALTEGAAEELREKIAILMKGIG